MLCRLLYLLFFNKFYRLIFHRKHFTNNHLTNNHFTKNHATNKHLTTSPFYHFTIFSRRAPIPGRTCSSRSETPRTQNNVFLPFYHFPILAFFSGEPLSPEELVRRDQRRRKRKIMCFYHFTILPFHHFVIFSRRASIPGRTRASGSKTARTQNNASTGETATPIGVSRHLQGLGNIASRVGSEEESAISVSDFRNFFQ